MNSISLHLRRSLQSVFDFYFSQLIYIVVLANTIQFQASQFRIFEGQTRPHGLDQNPAALFLTLSFRVAAIPPNLVPNAPLSGCVMGP